MYSACLQFISIFMARGNRYELVLYRNALHINAMMLQINWKRMDRPRDRDWTGMDRDVCSVR